MKSECLDKLILFGERSLRNACAEYLIHYLDERFHQGLGGQLINNSKVGEVGETTRIDVSERMGGLLKFYQRAA